MTREEPWKKPTTKKPDPTNFFASTKRCIVVSLFGLPSQGGGAGRGRGGDEIDRQLHGQAQEKIAREFLRRPSAGAGGHVLKHQGERGRGDPAEGRKEGYIYIAAPHALLSCVWSGRCLCLLPREGHGVCPPYGLRYSINSLLLCGYQVLSLISSRLVTTVILQVHAA